MSAPLAIWHKDPDALLDYAIDWSLWLMDCGNDLLTSSTFTVPAGITLSQQTYAPGGLVQFWLSGGTAGTTYSIVNHITTQSGRAEDRTVNIIVTNR